MVRIARWQIILLIIKDNFGDEKSFSDRVKNVNDKLNELVKTDSWLAKNWHGAIHLEELIKDTQTQSDLEMI